MDYIEGLDLSASHIAIIKEGFYRNRTNTLKCRIPVLMPNIPDSDPLELNTRISKSNLLNKVKDNIRSDGSIKTSNYINITIPEFVINQFSSENEHGYVYEGNKKIIITFINGDINHIQVLGRYY